MPANECHPFKQPGGDITGHANVALTGKRFCAIVGNRQSGPGLSATSEGGNYLIGKPAAGGRVLGVIAHDIAIGGKVNVIRGPGFIVPVVAAAAIAAFEEVQVDVNGAVIPKAAGVAVGFAMSAAANGADAEIALY